MKHRDRLLRAALRLVDVNRTRACREQPYAGDLAFMAEVDAVIDIFNEAIDQLKAELATCSR